MNSNKIPRCGHLLLRLVQVNQGPSLSYKETAEGLEIWGARKIQKSFDETGFASKLGPLILPKYEGAIAPHGPLPPSSSGPLRRGQQKSSLESSALHELAKHDA